MVQSIPNKAITRVKAVHATPVCARWLVANDIAVITMQTPALDVEGTLIANAAEGHARRLRRDRLG